MAPAQAFAPRQHRSDGGWPIAFACAAIAIGVVLGVVSDGRWPLAAGAAAAICLAVPLLLHPTWVPALLVLAIMVIDEFPSGLGEVAERSLRTPFYSVSLGAPALYAPDLLIGLGIALLVAQRLLARRPIGLRGDRIAAVVAAVVLAILAAFASSISNGDPLREVVIQETTGTEIDINARGLQLIGVFQLKMLLTLPLAYLLGRLWLAEPGARRTLMACLGLGIAGNLVVGAVRLAADPGMPAAGIPLFYDSPSTWFFALFILYTVAGWAWRLHRRRQTFWFSAASMVLLLFIAVSFRRTMWGASLLAGGLLLVLLPGRRRAQMLVVAFGLAACLGAVVMMTPLQDAVVGAVVRRLSQTSENDLSTVYRVAIALYMAEHLQDIPFFGYGVQPLWNELVALGQLRTNIENVHSLYYWWFLRAGWFGLVLAAIGAVTVLVETWRAHVRARLPDDKVLGALLLAAFLMMAFSGVFNPVYGESRYMVMIGLGLALLSRLREDIRAHEVAIEKGIGE
jgi:O-antigen ligase